MGHTTGYVTLVALKQQNLGKIYKKVTKHDKIKKQIKFTMGVLNI